jgi:hypothetical protein
MIHKPVSSYEGKKLTNQSHLNSTLNTVENDGFRPQK